MNLKEIITTIIIGVLSLGLFVYLFHYSGDRELIESLILSSVITGLLLFFPKTPFLRK